MGDGLSISLALDVTDAATARCPRGGRSCELVEVRDALRKRESAVRRHRQGT
jgi:hypothetical protein